MGALTLKENIFADAGIDVKGLIQRFMGNEALAERFLKKFISDESFDKLKTAIEEGNCEDAFKAVHTLKGVAGNLGLMVIFESADRMTEKLRAGDMSTAAEDCSRLEQVYLKAVNVINTEL